MVELKTLQPGISQLRRAARTSARAVTTVEVRDRTAYNNQETLPTSTRANVFDGGAENAAFQA